MTRRREPHDCCVVPDEGFSLIEVLVALFVLTFVSIATATFMVGAMGTTAEQSRKQTAIGVATRALERVQAVEVAQVLKGRSAAQVDALNADPLMAPLVVQDVVVPTSDTLNYDTDPGTVNGPQPVPVIETPAPVVKGTTYAVRTALNACWLSDVTHACTRAKPTGITVSVLRATVNVRWGDSSCGSRCSYSVSGLLDDHTDPQFDIATSQPIIVTASPQTVTATQGALVTFTGVALANNPALSVPAGGGSFSGATRVGSDGKRSTATWTAGSAPGAYTLTWVNPDGGRAEYSSFTVLPWAKPDCLAWDDYAPRTVAVLGNDVPSTGTVTITSQPSTGTATVDASGQITYTPVDQAPGPFTVGYTTTVNGVTSAPAVLTLRVRAGSC